MKTRNIGKCVAFAATGAMIAASTGCSVGGGAAGGENFPSDEITVLVPYGAGGPTDLNARSVAKVFEDELDATVVVENKPGASGAKMTQELISSKPDGYTIGLVTAGTIVLTPLANDVGYTHSDMDMLGMLSEVPSLIAVGKDSPYSNAEEFFQAAKANPGEISVGVPGASTMQAMELQRLSEQYGVDVTAVPFDGSSEMRTALLGGNVDAVFISLAKEIPQFIERGEMVPIAVSPAERLPWLPDVPTLKESGFEELTLSGSTYGLAVPEGTPEKVVGQLEDALEVAHDESAFVKSVGKNYIRDEFCDAECLTQLLDDTQTTYEPVISD